MPSTAGASVAATMKTSTRSAKNATAAASEAFPPKSTAPRTKSGRSKRGVPPISAGIPARLQSAATK